MALTSQDTQTTSLIDQTVSTFAGGIQSTTPQDGLSLIDQWIDRLDEIGSDETDEIADVLEDLKAELDPNRADGETPEPSVVQAYLEDLVDITQSVLDMPEVAPYEADLQRLTATLEQVLEQVQS
jgi:hypothetical protein